MIASKPGVQLEIMMAVALNTFVQEKVNKPSRPRMTWLMTGGFLIYTLLILLGHIVGFPLGYAYLHTVCLDGCALTPENVSALERYGLSMAFYANFYMVIQVFYILVCVGVALLMVFKKPGQWVPLGMSAFLVGLSAYEGANYPALATAYPVLNAPTQLLIGLGMGLLGMYALLTFPNGKFGSRWVLLFYLVDNCVVVLSAFITTPIFISVIELFSFISFPVILGVLIYRYRRILNAKERAATRWIIVSLSFFIPFMLLVFLLIPALAPADSLALLIVNIAGFFGCGINIAGFLMAVMYANAFDIDVFVRRTLVYTSLTAILVLLYAGMVFGSQFVFATFSPQAASSPLILVGSTLVIAALFQPLRHRIQQTIDQRFYRQKYDASRVIDRFSASLRSQIDLAELSEHLESVVQETMQPTHVTLWLRDPEREQSKQQKVSG